MRNKITKKSFLQSLYDLLFMPFRLTLLPDDVCEKIGLTSLQEERLSNVRRYIEGKVLDIGCGDNRLVRDYGNGVGVDVYDWGSDALLIEDSSSLPFDEKSFDTVTFVAALNHVPNRKEVVKETHRVLKEGGKAIVTMINPVLGFIGHKLWWYSEDKKRAMLSGETFGLWNHEIIRLFEMNGFTLEIHRRFVYWMNNLFVFSKK